jgi:hypothetical protein
MTTGTLTIRNAAREASIARNKEVIAFRKNTSALKDFEYLLLEFLRSSFIQKRI